MNSTKKKTSSLVSHCINFMICNNQSSQNFRYNLVLHKGLFVEDYVEQSLTNYMHTLRTIFALALSLCMCPWSEIGSLHDVDCVDNHGSLQLPSALFTVLNADCSIKAKELSLH